MYSKYTKEADIEALSYKIKVKHLDLNIDPIEDQTVKNASKYKKYKDTNEEAIRAFLICPMVAEIVEDSQNSYNILPEYAINVNADGIEKGLEATLDQDKKLNGRCDLIVCKSEKDELKTSLKEAPFLIFEIKAGREEEALYQCSAEMIGLKVIRDNAEYGVITNGSTWRFLKIKDKTVFVDEVEYYIDKIEVIMGIISNILKCR